MDQNSKIRERIVCCETAYKNCFSELYENDEIIRYRDSQLADMYDHNFTTIRKALPKEALRKLIQNEMEQNRQENKDYCKVRMDEKPEEEFLKEFNSKWEIEQNGEYVYMPMTSPMWKTVNQCKILKIADSSMVEDLVSFDVIVDSDTCGEDFCIRRARRRGKVYISEKPLDSYLCYLKGVPVGKCDLFLTNSIAKIEDFVVLPKYQRQGIGTTILKYLIDKALSNGAETIYLVADEQDTAKEMYMKLGFEKVGDTYAIFVKL